MTDTRRPDPCHYDRALGERVTNQHRDDCENPADHRGCAPCTAPHCTICGRNHATNDQPQTCPTCQLKIDQDLTTITQAHTDLATEALEAGADGRLVAAAPIPGGTAQILIGPTTRLSDLRTYRGWTPDTFAEDHPTSTKTGRPADPLPPLAVLAHWEDTYRAWLGHTSATTATVNSAVRYLRTQLPHIAQATDGPDFLDFTRQIRALRAVCERALHDEREPERGVECFECGDKLVRRFHAPARCTHSTPERAEFGRWLQLGYPEALTRGDVRAARRPCGRCNQGGITDPGAGLSWECPGCRKEYDPGEYATAVRRDLLTGGPDRDGWTHVTMAAEAASTLVGMIVPAGTVRKWVERGKVASRLNGTGVRLVFWPDVADEAVAAVRRSELAELRRRRRAERTALEAAETAEGDRAS